MARPSILHSPFAVPQLAEKPPCGPPSQSMPLRVLIVPDKFKGTLTAAAAAQAIAD